MYAPPASPAFVGCMTSSATQNSTPAKDLTSVQNADVNLLEEMLLLDITRALVDVLGAGQAWAASAATTTMKMTRWKA